MNIVEYNIHELKPASYNPRTLSEKQFVELKESMEKFGTMEPAIINVHPGREGIIISGHQRLKIAESLGLDVYPCVEVDLPENEEKELNIRMNKNTGSWDFDVLANQFDMGDLMEWGFEEEELIGKGEGEEGGGEDPGAGALPDKPKTELGRIYQLGNHFLMCGDSFDNNSLKLLMKNEKAAMCFTSPPYNVGTNSKLSASDLAKSERDGQKYQEFDDNIPDFQQFLMDMTQNAMEFSEYFFCNIQMLANNMVDIVHWIDYYADFLAEVMIWNKGFGQPAMAERVCNSAFEFIYIFSDDPSRAIGTRNFRGTIPNIFEIGSNTKNEYASIHNAVFPLELPALFLDGFTNKGEIILDIFGGTGTTLIACEQTGRHCRMMELDPQYVQVIIERWERMTNETAIDIESGKKWDELNA